MTDAPSDERSAVPYHPPVPPSRFVVAVVGDHSTTPVEYQTAAWVAGRDAAWAGAWVIWAPPSPVGTAAGLGAREHGGTSLAFAEDGQWLVTPDDVPADHVVYTGLTRYGRAGTLAANAHALLALPGDAETMAQIAAARMRGVPTAQLITPFWTAVETLKPTEVTAWLQRQMRSRAQGSVPDPPPVDDQPDEPDEEPQTEPEPAETTPASESEPESYPSPT